MTEAMVVRCVTCGSEVPASGRFCSACGGRLASDDLPTFSTPARAPSAPASAGPPAASSTPRSGPALSPQGRFIPGSVLASRYRIVAWCPSLTTLS